MYARSRSSRNQYPARRGRVPDRGNRRRANLPPGKNSVIGYLVLLLLDLAAVPGLAVVTALGTEPDSLASSLGLAALKAVVALVLLMALGRLVLRPLYRTIAATRNPELFFAATLLVMLGTAWGIAQAGRNAHRGRR